MIRSNLAPFGLALILAAAAPAANAAFAPRAAGAAIDRAAPLDLAWHRGQPHGGRIVCTIRHRPFYNGLFWRMAPMRVCWRS